MDRATARRVIALAIPIGLATEILLDGPAFGINVPIAVALLLSSAWLVRRSDRAPDRLDMWLPIGAILLSVLVAVRADPFMALLDVTAALVLTGASIAAFSGLAVTRRSASIVIAMAAWAFGAVLLGAASVVSRARPAVPASGLRRPGWAMAVGRGLFLGVPLAAIFAILFASADPIFGRAVEDVLGLRIDLGDLPGRLAFALAATWFAAGLLSVAANGIPPMEWASLGAASRTATLLADRALGTTEALVILVIVDALFGLFVGLQLAYLFGGQDTLAAAGLTYSAYARRGYFELVAAACLAGAVLVALELNVLHRSRAYLSLAVGLVALTVVVLASAALRLQLYQEAYGWTELRLYVAVSIIALAVTLLTLAGFVAVDRTRWLGHAMAVIGLASLIGLNLLAPSAFVASRNVDRAIHPELVPPDGKVGLDASYLGLLPDDAVPVLVAALPDLPAQDAAAVRQRLEIRRAQLANDPTITAPAAWNLGRERARAALATMP
jgi:Domain of unknown function (DUF4153)